MQTNRNNNKNNLQKMLLISPEAYAKLKDYVDFNSKNLSYLDSEMKKILMNKAMNDTNKWYAYRQMLIRARNFAVRSQNQKAQKKSNKSLLKQPVSESKIETELNNDSDNKIGSNLSSHTSRKIFHNPSSLALDEKEDEEYSGDGGKSYPDFNNSATMVARKLIFPKITSEDERKPANDEGTIDYEKLHSPTNRRNIGVDANILNETTPKLKSIKSTEKDYRIITSPD